MTIGLISNLYPPYARGGAEQIVRRTAHELDRRGHRVFILTTRPFAGWKSMRQPTVERLVGTVYRFYPPNLYHPLNDWHWPWPARAVWHLTDMWSRHIHTLHDVQLSVPSGLLMAGQDQGWMNYSPLRLWYEQQVKGIVGSPHVVISPSKFLADFYEQRGFFPMSRREVLPNPAPDVRMELPGPRQAGPLRLLYAGQLEPHKGVQLLLETLNTFDLPFELHIAGEGSLAGYVSEWAQRDSRVTYHGFESLENLVNLFAVCDGVVVPSLCFENSPTIIYESFLAGVPVVASNIGGVGELVQHGKNGYLVTPGHADELRAAFRRLAADTDQFRARQGEIRKSIAAHSLSNYVNRLEGFIRDRNGK
ncbi:MAG: hypothetical protein UY77_C0039G0002 [Candidatus Uhrbacteria bacterium GW2011_GWA2_53_10]|uniref:Glycosyltransferase subfamily 4-like N-terminal domain-containing protein n=1 Tax=Candidatus Uhrbacteria bacterium GW2011_GWA2_53_10 TaxID=1618980 RepID=A0A0G1XL56_9BACT|nr:MAG: hypothetical protein UY77_C0039G0002 [Candidatus Uhrbacteria bacterium GW2011_GWA2_53_10]